MNTTLLFAEYLITGFVGLIGIFYVLDFELTSLSRLTTLNNIFITSILIAFSYVIGFITNVLAEAAFQPLYNKIEHKWKSREGNPAIALDHIRYDLYASGNAEIIRRLDYHRALLRIARSISIISLFLLIFASLKSELIDASFFLGLCTVSLLAYQRRIIWFTKTVYFSWLALARNSKKNLIINSDPLQQNIRITTNKHNKNEPSFIIFAGGTGFRQINIELLKLTSNVTRIVPIWDNGGSSKILRESFNVIPVGDIRHVLMTMAHGEGRAGDVIRFFNWRLPDSGSCDDLRNEFRRFTTGEHPLIKNIEASLRDVILKYLQIFETKLPNNFDLKRGSLGNFVLMGAYISHANELNTAIYVFRQLCSINGNVWPVSLDSNLHIAATLENEEIIIGQELVTTIDRNRHREKIRSIFFTDSTSHNNKSGHFPSATANKLVLEALKSTDIIVFGPGSFFTSILPHLMVEGIADTIASLEVPKVLIGNILECNETYNYTLEECVEQFLNTAHTHANIKRPSNKYLTHIVANDNNGLISIIPGTSKRYLPLGKNISRFSQDNIFLIKEDFEDLWYRGSHDSRRISQLLATLNS